MPPGCSRRKYSRASSRSPYPGGMIPERLAWLTTGAPADLTQRFSDAGYQLYLVGGSVRDALLGRDSDDVDLTTDARPDTIKSLLSDWADDLFTLGEAFGTIGTIKGGVRYEITTFRSEIYIEESRKPTVTFGDTIERDLERRDFTVNAMALRLGVESPELVDPLPGSGGRGERDAADADRARGLVLR